MGPVHYNNKRFRIAAAFAASSYMLMYGRPFDLYQAVTSPSFYFVLAIGFSAALLLVEFVHFITKKLDRRYGWRSSFIERLVAQIILGVLTPAGIDLLFFYIYFKILGGDIFKNGFFHIDLPVITGFLTLLSFYYCLRYWMLTDIINVQKHLELAMTVKEDKEDNNQEETVWTEQKGQRIYFNSENIICFYRLGRNVNFLVKDGKEYPINSTISALEDRYSKNGFVRVNRGMVINIKCIIGHKTGPRKNTLQLIIHENYNNLILKLGREHFQVTKEYISAFKENFGS